MSQPTSNLEHSRRVVRRWRRLWPWLVIPPLLLIAGAAIVAGSLGTMSGDSSTQAVNVPRDVGIDQKLGAQVPLETVFRDEQGRDVRLQELLEHPVAGKPVILALVYLRCPMLC